MWIAFTGTSMQELQDQAKENMRMRDKIEASKAVYSAQKLQHEYLENVSRIDRLTTFRGPASACHRSMRVKENLDVAKSMRMSQHLPGTFGYQKELSRSMKHSRSQSARTPGRYSSSASLLRVFLSTPTAIQITVTCNGRASCWTIKQDTGRHRMYGTDSSVQ